MPKSLSQKLLDRAIMAMVASVEIYNKPIFSYREDAFVILALNAWELLLKAKWLDIHGNKKSCLYEGAGGTASKKKYKKTSRDGKPHSIGVGKLVEKLHSKGHMDKSIFENLQLLIEYRNTSMHFLNQSPNFRFALRGLGVACVKNFTEVTKEWFNKDLSKSDLHLMPLALFSLSPQIRSPALTSGEKVFIDSVNKVESDLSSSTKGSQRYHVTLHPIVQFTHGKSAQAQLFQMTNDPMAPRISLSDDEFSERYPWDYKKLRQLCKEQIPDFKIDRNFHAVTKGLKKDQKFTYVRYPDPKNPKGPGKAFYSPRALDEIKKRLKNKR